MQEKPARRSNPARSRATRAALIAAARELFVTRGYADTSTPQIVAAAGLTRGALYHHFADKRDLFRAVVTGEAAAVAAEIEAAAPARLPPGEALAAGARAYLDAMAVPGRTRLLLVDGPAVLGSTGITAIDTAHAGRTLRQGLMMAAPYAGNIPALADLLSASFDFAAMAIEAGEDRAAYEAAILVLLRGATERGVAGPD